MSTALLDASMHLLVGITRTFLAGVIPKFLTTKSMRNPSATR